MLYIILFVEKVPYFFNSYKPHRKYNLLRSKNLQQLDRHWLLKK